MALEPSISWWTFTDPVAETGLEALTMWSLGTVEADGNPSLTRKKFIVWNNKGGSVGLQTMRNVTLGTRDTSGGFNLSMVQGKWVHGYFPMDSSTPFEIGADLIGNEWTAIEMPIQGTGTATGEVEGGINDGTLTQANASRNFAKFQLEMAVPTSASAGAVQAKLRVGYEITG